MIEINLLPKNYLKGSKISLGKTGIYAIAAALGVMVMLVSITFYQVYQLSNLEQNIEKAQQRAAILQQDIRVVDGLIDVKGKITQRMQAVENLDRHRTVWVRILEDMARNVPEFVWLGSFKERIEETASPEQKAQNKKQQEPAPAAASQLPTMRKVELEGYAFTLNALAAFMIKMMRSDYFDEVELLSSNETKFGEKEKAYNFVMSCNLHYLSDEELQQQIAQAEEETTPSDSKTSHKTLN
ncbi:MAG: PilN domain-containing protein [candidate division Zixibacteria bacterium]|nr:PilN domain-containing protein [candidate division Zixibacteria bacterium]